MPFNNNQTQDSSDSIKLKSGILCSNIPKCDLFSSYDIAMVFCHSYCLTNTLHHPTPPKKKKKREREREKKTDLVFHIFTAAMILNKLEVAKTI